LLAFKTDEELEIVRGLVHRMVERALALDGTCKSPKPWEVYSDLFHTRKGTGEHGVGIGKKEFLVEELGAGTVALMKTIKRAIDPLGIMNPGKVQAYHILPMEFGSRNRGLTTSFSCIQTVTT